MNGCDGGGCPLVLTAFVYDRELGALVEARCTEHGTVLYGADQPPNDQQRLVRGAE